MNASGPLSAQRVSEFLGRAQDVHPDPSFAHPACPVEQIGEQWQRLGLRPGDLVLLSLPTHVSLLAHFFGVLHGNGVPVLTAPGVPAARLQDLADVLGARAVGAVRLPAGLSGAERVAEVDQIQVAMFPPRADPPAAPGEVVLLTSGTSGFASGCVFGIESLLLNAARHAEAFGQRQDDTVLVNLPLHFSFALVAQALATLVQGGRLVVGGPPFHPGSYLAAIQRHGVTLSSLTPVLARALLRSGLPPPPALRVLSVGGDALPAEDVEKLLRWRHGAEFYLTYGLTEAGPRVSTLAAHREPAARWSSVGLPLPGTWVHLEPVAGHSAARQLIVRSKTVMQRRIGRVEGREDGAPRPPGEVATGDVFDQDDAGYLYFRGRLTDFVVRGDEKICLAAVRRVACRLPGVLRASTRAGKNENGDSDFDLTLVTAGGEESAEHFHRLLRHELRRNELPQRILVQSEDRARSAYK